MSLGPCRKAARNITSRVPARRVGVVRPRREKRAVYTPAMTPAEAEATREREALYTLTDKLHRASSLDDIYAASLDAIVSGLRCDRASILLYDAKGVMRFVAWRGLSDEYRAVAEGHSPWTRETKNPEPVSIADAAQAPLDAALKQRIALEGIRAAAFIPLVSEGVLIGKFMAYFNVP